MKIAFYHNVPAGGAKRVVYEQVKHLSKKHKVEVFEFKSEDSKYCDLKKITRVNQYLFVPANNLPFFLKRIYSDIKIFYSLKKINHLIAQHIDTKGFDIVVVHSDKYIQAPYLLRYLKTPSIYYAHETLRYVYESHLIFNKKNFILKKWYENLTRYIRKNDDIKNINSATKILCNSKYTSENIMKTYGLESVVSYPGVDAIFFRPLKFLKKIDILFIGEKVSNEGYEILLGALKQMRKYIVVKILDRKNDRFSLSDQDLVKEYNKSKIVLALNTKEPFGLIPLEAMSCGVPVIAVSEGGFRETVLNNITGYLIEKSPNALKTRIEKLLSNSSLHNAMGKNARNIILKEWDIKKRMLEFEKLIYSFIEKEK